MAVMLALVTTVTYWPATHCNFVNCDDDLHVTANAHVQKGLSWETVEWAFLNPVNTNWHPLTVLSHMLDCQLFGLKPWGHHLSSVLLHALNTILVFLLLRRLTGSLWRSALVAAVFGLHPLHVESVAWVSERKDVLSTCFGMLSLIFYARYAQARPSLESRDPRALKVPFLVLGPWSINYGLALWFFVLGLMSKGMLVTWPFVMLLLDYWPLRRFRFATLNSQLSTAWRLLAEKAPFFAVAVVASVVTYLVQQHEGALPTFQHLSLGARIGNALISYCRYLGKLFWPTDLAVFYPHPGYWPLEEVLLAGALLVGITALLVVERRRYPFLLMGWLWYCGTLVPVIQLVQTGSHAMADRYTYIPSLGVLMMVIWGACELVRRWRYQVIALSVAGLAVLALCTVLTRRQIGYWQDSETLFRHALAVTENNHFAHNNLGTALIEKGQPDEALKHYQEAVRLQPDAAMAHYNLGTTLIKAGQTDEAIRQFREAIHLKPDDAKTRNNLGMAFVTRGQLDEAIRQFQEVLRLNPNHVDAHYNLGTALGMKGQIEEAILQFQQALRLKPDYAEAHNNLGNTLRGKGQINEAISQFQEAIRLKPDDPEFHGNLGAAFVQMGQIDEAINQLKEALRLKPNDAKAHNNLGTALAGQGRLDEAILQFQEALRLKPADAEARSNLGTAFAQKGQFDEAIRQFQEALRLNPDAAGALNYLGYLWTERGENLEQAYTMIEKAVRLEPKNAAFLDSLGWVLFKLNRPREGLDHLLQAVKTSGSPRAAFYDHLGDVYAALDQRDQAVEAWRKSLSIAPNQEVQRKLNEWPSH
jgi:protein O-mannosyl-transferase